MRIQCDSLKYARLLGKKGVKSGAAEGFMSTLTQIESLISTLSMRWIRC